jgi:hypothetical protein
VELSPFFFFGKWDAVGVVVVVEGCLVVRTASIVPFLRRLSPVLSRE